MAHWVVSEFILFPLKSPVILRESHFFFSGSFKVEIRNMVVRKNTLSVSNDGCGTPVSFWVGSLVITGLCTYPPL